MAERHKSSAAEGTQVPVAEDIAKTTAADAPERAGPLVLSRDEGPIMNGLSSLMDDSINDYDDDICRGSSRTSSGSVKSIREKFNSPRNNSGGQSMIDVDMTQFYKKQRAQSVTYQQKKREASVTNSRLSILASPTQGTGRSSLQDNINAIQEMKFDIKEENSPQYAGEETREMEGEDKEEKKEESPVHHHSKEEEKAVHDQNTKSGGRGGEQGSDNHLVEESVSTVDENCQEAKNVETNVSVSCKHEEGEEEGTEGDEDSICTHRRPSPVSTFFDKRLTTFTKNMDVIKTEAGALASLWFHHNNKDKSNVDAMDHHNRESPKQKSDLEEQ